MKLTEAKLGHVPAAHCTSSTAGRHASAPISAGPPADFVIAQRLVETEAAPHARAGARPSRRLARTATISTSSARTRRVCASRWSRRDQRSASTSTVPTSSSSSPFYDNLRKAYARLVEILGAAAVSARARDEVAARPRRSTSLRAGAIDLAKEGMQRRPLQGSWRDERRELWDDDDGPRQPHARPRRRRGRGSAADQIFSMLMGDQVEPRRDFIDKNAIDVRFLDV